MSQMPVGFNSGDPSTTSATIKITDSNGASVFNGELQNGQYQEVATSNFAVPFEISSSVTDSQSIGADNCLVVVTYGPNGTGGSTVICSPAG